MRILSDAERRKRIAEDTTLESPRWRLILTGVATGIIWIIVAGWFVVVPFHAFEWIAAPMITGMLLPVLVVLLPLLHRRSRQRWIILNGFETKGRIVDYKLDGMASSGTGFKDNDNYPVIIATVTFKDKKGRQRTGYIRRTVHSFKKRDLEEILQREIVIYWHERYPDQVVPAAIRL